MSPIKHIARISRDLIDLRKSSKWLNESGLLLHHFEWQYGFGAFSYSHKLIDNMFKYIQNQE